MLLVYNKFTSLFNSSTWGFLQLLKLEFDLL